MYSGWGVLVFVKCSLGGAPIRAVGKRSHGFIRCYFMDFVSELERNESGRPFRPPPWQDSPDPNREIEIDWKPQTEGERGAVGMKGSRNATGGPEMRFVLAGRQAEDGDQCSP